MNMTSLSRAADMMKSVVISLLKYLPKPACLCLPACFWGFLADRCWCAEIMVQSVDACLPAESGCWWSVGHSLACCVVGPKGEWSDDVQRGEVKPSVQLTHGVIHVLHCAAFGKLYGARLQWLESPLWGNTCTSGPNFSTVNCTWVCICLLMM